MLFLAVFLYCGGCKNHSVFLLALPTPLGPLRKCDCLLAAFYNVNTVSDAFYSSFHLETFIFISFEFMTYQT